MFNTIVNFFIKVITWLAGIIISIISFPIYLLLNPAIPNLSSYLDTFSTFLTDKVFRGLAFAREVFFNVTGFPRSLFYALVTFYLFKLGFRLTMLVFYFLFNLYHIIRGSKTESGS